MSELKRLGGRSPGALAGLLVDLVLPPICPSCRRAVGRAHALCAGCWGSIRFIEAPICAIYGTPLPYAVGENAVSAEALADPPPFRRARSAAIYGDVARALVQKFKYQDMADMVHALALPMHRAGRVLFPECDIIVPVPLHRWRLWRRRFNQSALLAAELSSLSGLQHDPLALERVRRTPQQVGLSATQRQTNVRGAFRVPDAKRSAIDGRSVLLVDDVYTSGATVKAATRALLRGGASAVDVLTFARVAG